MSDTDSSAGTSPQGGSSVQDQRGVLRQTDQQSQAVTGGPSPSQVSLLFSRIPTREDALPVGELNRRRR